MSKMADEQEIAPDECLKTEIETPSDESAAPEPKTETDERPKTDLGAEPEERDGAEAEPEAGCPTKLGFGGLTCHRKLHPAPTGVDEQPVCLMHSKDECKKSGPLFEEFWIEFERILEEAGAGAACFEGFVFPELFLHDRKFKAVCRFNGAVFTQGADFYGSTFEQDAEFFEATFVQEASFVKANFMKKVQFINATFTKKADFFGASFEQSAIFFGATFNEGASFHSGTFTQGTVFNVATFTQYANFSMTAFAQKADFMGATFTLDAIFEGTKFDEEANWLECRFLGQAKFRRTEFKSENEGTPSAVFSLAEFAKPEDVVFDRVDLSRTLFVNCDVSEFWFTSTVQWAKRKGDRGLAVFEEKILLDSKFSEMQKRYVPIDHGAVEQIYHQLKKNYDARLDYRKANEFHFGEMEMRRLEARNFSAFLKPWRWLRPWLGPEAWDLRASDYGNSYVKPILWLLATLFMAAALFPISGLEIKLPKPKPATTYQSAWNKQDTWTNNRWTEAKLFGNSFIAAVDTATFQRNPEYTPSYP